MTDFRKIEKICNSHSELFKDLIDEFLIYYCYERENLQDVFVSKLKPFTHVIQEMPEEWLGFLMSQYSAFRLFRKNGHAQQYLKHPKIVSRSKKEKEFLSFLIANPWRYCFCSVANNPSLHFFEMKDILTGEDFLLYSPSLTHIHRQKNPLTIYLFLLSFNGHCRQTYGNIAYLEGFITSDLLFFAQQLNPKIESLNQLPEMIDRDPLPWTLLWKKGGLPLLFHGKDLMVYNCSKYLRKDFNPDSYSSSFKIQKKNHLCRMSLKRWGSHPHFAECYYNYKKHELILVSLTDRGYAKLIETFNKAGYDLPENPRHSVTFNMRNTVQEFLKNNVQLNPYEKSFTTYSGS